MLVYLKNKIKSELKYRLLYISLMAMLISFYGPEERLIKLGLLGIIAWDTVFFFRAFMGRLSVLLNLVAREKSSYYLASLVESQIWIFIYLSLSYLLIGVNLGQKFSMLTPLSLALRAWEFELILWSIYIIVNYSLFENKSGVGIILSLFFTSYYYRLVFKFNRLYNKVLVLPGFEILTRRDLKNNLGLGQNLNFTALAFKSQVYLNYLAILLRLGLLGLIVGISLNITCKNLKR